MNMRKIIAVLSAVLMLCAIVPMSVFAADGDVVFSNDFESGEKKFNAGDIVAEGPDGSNCYKWTATGGWSATYMVLKDMDSSKDYTITMKAKGSVAGGMGITIQNGDWGSYWNGPSFQVTTEWQDIVVELPAGSIPFASGSILFKFQDVGVAMDLYVDDLVIAEGLPKKPLCENGDFETGDFSGWSTNSKAQVEAAAAHSGNYGAHLIGTGDWGGMMERTFDTEIGKNYELSFWIKTNAVGVNIQLKENTWQGASVAGAGGWFNKTEWTYIAYTFTATSAKTYLNFCGANTGTFEDLYVDDVKLLEIKDPSFDGYLYNGDFETGKSDSWTNLWDSSTVEIVEGRDGGYALKGTASGAYNIVYQEVNVTPNTDYTVWAYTKDASGSNLWIKNAGGNGDITNKAFASGEWALTSVSFNSGSNNTVWVGLMGLNAGSTYIVDDIFMFETQPESNDGYIKNGTFETGALTPWNNLWGSCPKAEIIRGGKDDNFALDIVSGQWKHVRQTNIAVEANTDYKISVWAKNTKNMSLLVKDNGDSANIVNQGISAGDEWTLFEAQFNSGANTAILVSFMGGAEEAYGTFDNVVMEKLHTCNVVEQERVEPTCGEDGYVKYACDCGLGEYTETLPATGEHTPGAEADCENDQVCTVCGEVLVEALGHIYSDCEDTDCDECGAVRDDAGHNLTYVEAVVPANCQETGHDEYWMCTECGAYFGDAEGSYQVNPAWMYYTGEHVRPEGAADCAIVPCELCGEDTYGYGEHDTGVPACQTGTCSKCGETIEGYGCQNYDTPACEDGVCYYCGGFVAGFGHENGAWAACCDGECSYGCGLVYPATEDHVDETHQDENGDTVEGSDGFCDTCWTHLNHDVDPCVGGECSICWTYVEGAHTYDNEFDTTCNVCGETITVELPISHGGFSIKEDKDGIGLAAKFDIVVSGMDIAEGKKTQADYTNATVNGYELISMGAIVTNGKSTINIPAVYLCDLAEDEGTASYAIRIIEIPADKQDVVITFTPYFVVKIEGKQVTVEGAPVARSYNG